MKDNKNKKIILCTLILGLCIFVVSLYCFIPSEKKKETVDIYTISFDTGSGTPMAIKVEEGGTIVLPDEPTREGYIFIGWMYNGEPFDFSQEVTEDITLTAGWKKIEEGKKYYVVNFYTDGGTTIANQPIEEGAVPTRPENPTKDGYEFVEWQLNGVVYDFTTPITEDVTLVAIYKEIPQDNGGNGNGGNGGNNNSGGTTKKYYTVTFNNNGGRPGGNCSQQTIEQGGRAVDSCRPTRTDYIFNGWLLNNAPFSFSTAINSNITLYASWTRNVKYYNLSFDANGGRGSCQTKSIAGGTNVDGSSYCSGMTKSHYVFDGWSRNNAGTLKGTFVMNADTKLYATWKKKTYTISGEPFGDSVSVYGHTITVNDVSDKSTITSLNICGVLIEETGETGCIDVAKNGMKTNFPNFYAKMVSCEIKFSDSDETFACRN